MRTIDPHQTFTPGSTGTYVDKDLSTYLNSDENCAVFIIETGQFKSNEVCRIRAKGATIDPPDVTIIPPGSAVYLTWVDTNKICQIRSSFANTQFHLIGAMSSGSILPTDLGDNYIDKTSGVGTTCTGLDLTSDVDIGDNPIGAFWQSGFLSTSDPVLEISQSTSTCANDVVQMQPMGSSLGAVNDTTDIAYLKKTNAPSVWLFGFVSDDSTVSRSAVTPIASTSDQWNDLEDIGATHDGAAYYFEFNVSGDVSTSIGLRKKGSTDNFITPWNQVHDGSTDVRGVVLYCEKGTSDTIQWFTHTSVTPSNIYRLAYLEQAPAGPIVETISENITLDDIIIITGGFQSITVLDNLTINDTIIPTGGSQEITVLDDLTINDILIGLRISSITVPDSLVVDDILFLGFIDILTENLLLNDTLVSQINFNPSIIDTIELDDPHSTSLPRFNTILENIELDDTPLTDLIAQIIENINLIDLTLSGATLNISLISGSGVGDNLLCIYPKTITEDINISLIELTQFQGTNTIQDSQAIAGLLSSNAIFYTTNIGFFTLNDSLAQIDIILEELQINDIHTVLANLYNTLLENETTTSININNLSTYLTNRDQLTINDGILSQHLGNVFLSDGLSFRINVEFADQEYSGWVMNPENYAVSTYSFRFTDSTLLGNKYLFASPLGLFVFGGKLDEEETIQSRIKTAALDFGSENVKQMRQAILGTDGDRWILSVSTDDDSTAQYELIAPSDGLSNKRMKIGKGLLGTRWQFELIHSREENFQLSSMEFFPVIFKRKLK